MTPVRFDSRGCWRRQNEFDCESTQSMPDRVRPAAGDRLERRSLVPNEVRNCSTSCGMEFLRSLNRRGLRGVKLAISDSHEGMRR
jgi:hypothetical protein